MTAAERELTRLRESEMELQHRIRQVEARVVQEQSRSPERRTTTGYYSPMRDDAQGEQHHTQPLDMAEREEGFDPSPRRSKYTAPVSQYPESFTGKVLCKDLHGSISPRRPAYEEPVGGPPRDFATRKQTRAGLWDQGKTGSKEKAKSPQGGSMPSPPKWSYRSYGGSERVVPPPLNG